MNKKHYPQAISPIVFLAFFMNNGCVELPKSRPETILKNPVANYKVKPTVHFLAHFYYVSDEGTKLIHRNKDDTFKKIIEKVVKENELFDSYSFEPIPADYEINISLSKWLKYEGRDLTFMEALKGFLYISSFTIIPVTFETEYNLHALLYDKSGKYLYSFYCSNESNDVMGPMFTSSFIPPTGMIEKMVKEALFNIIDNSGIIKSYKIEP